MDVKNKLVKLQIWDTAVHERFKNITAHYYRGAHGILLFYNVTDKDSFKNLESWLSYIEKSAPKNICKVLVGTNCDLEEKRVITTQKGKDFATSKGMKYIEVSAKENINIKKAFEILVEDIINSYEDKKASDLGEKNKIRINFDENSENCIIF